MALLGLLLIANGVYGWILYRRTMPKNWLRFCAMTVFIALMPFTLMFMAVWVPYHLVYGKQHLQKKYGDLDAALRHSAGQGPTQTSSSIPEGIKQLAELHGAGVLSDEEFSVKKAELLSRM